MKIKLNKQTNYKKKSKIKKQGMKFLRNNLS